MKFHFVCPEAGKILESDDFRIIEHQGVKVDKAGNKFLDAKIELDFACPFCGKKHVFHATELSCPFSPGKNQGANGVKNNSTVSLTKKEDV